jgi:hypothetical protein
MTMSAETDYSGYKECGHPEYRNTDAGPQLNDDCGCEPASTAMDIAEATAYRAAWNTEVKRLTRMSKSALAIEHRDALASQGATLIYGQYSKDELIRAVLGIRYPTAKLNEATHVVAHKPGEAWSACEWCAATVDAAMQKVEAGK